jgi:hypothetical protein
MNADRRRLTGLLLEQSHLFSTLRIELEIAGCSSEQAARMASRVVASGRAPRELARRCPAALGTARELARVAAAIAAVLDDNARP